MKTREELMAGFQQKFDKERKIRTWRLSLEFPFWIVLNGLLLIAIFFVTYVSVKDHSNIYFINIVLLVFVVAFNYAELGNFFEVFNPIEKVKKIKELLDQEIKKQNEWKEKRKSIEPVCDGGTTEIWMKLALEYHSCDQYEISELILKEGKELEDKLLELESQLEVYENCPEKNFWQYFKSKKWTKKVKSN